MEPTETPQDAAAETITTEQVTGARRVGLSKILVASLIIAVGGLAVVALVQGGGERPVAAPPQADPASMP